MAERDVQYIFIGPYHRLQPFTRVPRLGTLCIRIAAHETGFFHDLFCTLGTVPMEKNRIGMIGDIVLHLMPSSLIIPDFLACRTDGQEPFQDLHRGKTFT